MNANNTLQKQRTEKCYSSFRNSRFQTITYFRHHSFSHFAKTTLITSHYYVLIEYPKYPTAYQIPGCVYMQYNNPMSITVINVLEYFEEARDPLNVQSSWWVHRCHKWLHSRQRAASNDHEYFSPHSNNALLH